MDYRNNTGKMQNKELHLKPNDEGNTQITTAAYLYDIAIIMTNGFQNHFKKIDWDILGNCPSRQRDDERFFEKAINNLKPEKNAGGAYQDRFIRIFKDDVDSTTPTAINMDNILSIIVTYDSMIRVPEDYRPSMLW